MWSLWREINRIINVEFMERSKHKLINVEFMERNKQSTVNQEVRKIHWQ